jgi:hypothetical protein
MTRHLHHAAFFAGLAAVGWIGAAYAGHSLLALSMTLLIGVFYAAGAVELHRFRQATASLVQALAGLTEAPAALQPWVAQLHPSLQAAVRLRIEGERAALPGPALTPYLTGLLVLLGMLGTFLGMVVTLNGTGLALQSATDLAAVRASLAAPVKGLGLAFGTSVAGVAASAMLGLMSTWSRRERLQAAQLLDAKIATTLRPFSLAHQREASLQLLQRQAELMPAVVSQLQAMMAQMERQSAELNSRLLAGQEAFHGKAEAAYTGLAASVDRTLQQSLTESARVAAQTIRPAVEATMGAIARETSALHTAVAGTVQQQLDGLSARFEGTTTALAELWKAALAEHRHAGEGQQRELRGTLDQFAQAFDQRSAALVQAVGHSHDELRHSLAAQDQQRLAEWHQALQAMAASLQQQWQQAGAQTLAQQQQICTTLEHTARDISAQAQSHAKDTIAEIARLMQAAAEAPRAAAEVIAELRQKLSESLVRDNALLEERSRIMETLQTLLSAVNQASTEQRAAIDALVAQSGAMLERAGAAFVEKVNAEAGKVSGVAAQITGSAAEVASLGEAFGVGVQLFSESSAKLMEQLQRMEGALGKSLARSDEQLAYYVAQAREIIDLSIASQKQIVDDLQQLARDRSVAAEA